MIRICQVWFFLLAFFCGSCGSGILSNIDFYGADNREVKIEFATWVDIQKDELKLNSDDPVEILNSNKGLISDRIKKQTLHLYGAFTYHTSPTDFYSWPATIRETEKIRVKKIDQKKDHVRVSYIYEDIGVAYQHLLDGNSTVVHEIYLPNNPMTIYEKSMPRFPKKDPKTKLPINPCTDLHDNSDKAFFYYWSPTNKGCPKKIYKELHITKIMFSPLQETKESYPEYDRLSSDWKNDEGDSPTYTFYFGYDEKVDDPKDLGYISYMDFLGLVAAAENVEGKLFKKLSSSKSETIFETQDINGEVINVRAFIGSADSDEHDHLSREMMEQSSVFVYTGHSYEGFYFDPKRLFEQELMVPNKYQIFFMNSCTSYSYYHSNFFEQKSNQLDPTGTKALDVLTNAIGSPILADAKNLSPSLYGAEFVLLMELLGYDKNAKKRKSPSSWQQILKEIEEDVGYELSSLSQVIGDEDNEYSREK